MNCLTGYGRTVGHATGGHPWLVILAFCCLKLLSAEALCSVADEVADLRARIELLEEQLARIEERTERNGKTSNSIHEGPLVTPGLSGSTLQSRMPKVRLSADLRYRVDTIDYAAAPSRHHHRIRARASAVTRIAESISVGLGVSTGGVANDSANQTLGDAFSIKPMGLDLAYFDWSVSESLNILGGKMINPFYRPGRHHLMYDDDLHPEGLALSMNWKGLFGHASVFWAEERVAEPDSLWLGLQVGYRGQPTSGLAYAAGAGYYEVSNTRGRLPLFTRFGGQGNELDSDGNYLYGFSQAELFGELEVDVAGYPVTVFIDYVTNTAADAHKDGIALGLAYERILERRRWQFAYVYQNLEANAVLGAFTDSDFGGGISDSRGHVFRAEHTFNNGLYLALRYIAAERGQAANASQDYDRLQADFGLTY